IPEPDATLALAKQGVFSNWPQVRKLAASRLMSRKFEDFAPCLIALLATPVVRVDLPAYSNFRDNNFYGPVVLWHSYLLSRETEDQFQVAHFRTTDFRINDCINGLVLEGGDFRESRGNNLLDFGLTRGATDIARLVADGAQAQGRTLSDLN